MCVLAALPPPPPPLFPTLLPLMLQQAASEQPMAAEDAIAARIIQLFYDLDVEMLKATSSLSGCCCVAAAYAAPLLIVVSCGDCRFAPLQTRACTSRDKSSARAIFCGLDNACHCMTIDRHPHLKVVFWCWEGCCCSEGCC